jgi:hypothetical protein
VNVLLAVVRAVLGTVIVLCASLAVLWSAVAAPGAGVLGHLLLMSGAVCAAALLLAALPGKPRQRRTEDRDG